MRALSYLIYGYSSEVILLNRNIYDIIVNVPIIFMSVSIIFSTVLKACDRRY